MSIGENIKRLRESRNMTQSDLADALGLSPSAVSSWEIGAKSPRMGVIEKMATLFRVKKSDIIEGDETAERSPFSYKNILPVQRFTVPMLGSVAAGKPIYDESDFDTRIPVGRALKCDFALQVKGDSMEPEIHDGDIVLVLDQSDVLDGRVAVVAVGDEVTLKHVYHTRNGVTLVSDNPKYPPMAFTEDECDEIRIMGKPVAYLRGM